jgi:superfamily II DNA or RNA helicase
LPPNGTCARLRHLLAPEGLYDEFSARFPYDETEDQMAAIERVRDDLAAGQPMDRLVCGDVGFGKTEVALRAAFIAAMNGVQVAVVVPTTLLARQHFKTFTERLRGYPVNDRPGFAPGRRQGTGADQGQELADRQDRHRGRHPCAAWLVDPVRQSRVF